MLPSSSKSDLRSLFEQAIDMLPIDRANFVREIQFRSPILYKQLRSLLIAHQGPSAFFEQDGGLWAQLTPTQITGRRFGAYAIECEIGKGGMGAVYKATRADEVFHKTVAIKIISGTAVLSDSSLDAFRRERQILAQLEHPHIARLLDGGSTDDGLLYLIMEYVDGQSLDAFAREQKPSVEALLKLVLDVASAVSFAHRNLVVHRDLKPSNILVTKDGEVKLLDFGIAKVLSTDKAVTATVAMRLTPEFASPEQIRGESISTSTDVYSLGVILFHIMTGGARPYRTTSQAIPDLLQAVLESETPRPSAVAPPALAKRLRGDLDTIILKAMAKQPARRYASIDALSEDIRRHLSGRPILAVADNWGYRANKFIRRHQVAMGAALLILLSLAAGIVSTLRQSSFAQEQRAEAVAARRIAEDQRRLAILSQQQTELQRQLAERRSKEALAERLRAESQRGTAESRYQSIRSLATAILFDINETLRDLPGAAPAREKAVLTALKHLEGLAHKSSDPALNEDLASAYEQAGDIMSSLFDDPKDAAAWAIPAFQKALRLRLKIVAEKPAAFLKLSEVQRQLGNSQLNAGQTDAALASYRQSLQTLERLADTPDSRRLAALSRSNLCTAYTEREEVQKALPECAASIEILSKLPAGSHPDIAALRVVTGIRYGKLLRRDGGDEAANRLYRDALAEIDPLEAKAGPALEELVGLLKSMPAKAEYQSTYSAALRKSGVLLEREGKRDMALEQFEESLKKDGLQLPTIRDVLAYAEAAALQAEARSKSRDGHARQAIEVLKRALDRLAQCAPGGANLLREELGADLAAYESSLAQPPR